jgi:hypothetical protein
MTDEKLIEAIEWEIHNTIMTSHKRYLYEQAANRIRELSAALAYVNETATLHDYEFGPYHAGTNLMTNDVEYKCFGCRAIETSYWPHPPEGKIKERFPHNVRCKYLQYQSALSKISARGG